MNLHWFHIAIFPVTAVNSLKIRQYSLRNLLCYRKNCLCETASTCSAEFLQRISVRKGADGLTPVKTDKAEGFVKIQSTGNAGSSPRCLKTSHRIVFLTCKPIGVQFSYILQKTQAPAKMPRLRLKWWRRGELNSCPKTYSHEALRAQFAVNIPSRQSPQTNFCRLVASLFVDGSKLCRLTFTTR